MTILNFFPQEYLRNNPVSPIGSPSAFGLSPNSPAELKKKVKKLEESHKTVKRCLELEEDKVEMLLGKLTDDLKHRPEPESKRARIMCPFCSSDFARKDHLERHVKKAHEDKFLDKNYGNEKIPCDYYGEFKNRQYLQKHMKVCR